MATKLYSKKAKWASWQLGMGVRCGVAQQACPEGDLSLCIFKQLVLYQKKREKMCGRVVHSKVLREKWEEAEVSAEMGREEKQCNAKRLT